MLNVSAVPGSPQSSTSTVNGSVVVPAGRITEAVPLNVACLLPGVEAQEPGLLMFSPLIDCALIRTFIPWSLYSRFPAGAQHVATNPNVALELEPFRLGTRAGSEIRSPCGENSGSPSIWPSPVTFPGVVGGGV